MTMNDLSELTRNKDLAAYALMGCAVEMIESVRNGLEPNRKMWHTFDEYRMAYECARRDLDECFTTEAMVNSME